MLLIPSSSPAYRAVSSFAVVVEYTLLVVFPSSRLTATTKGLDTLLALSLSPVCHGVQTDKPCDVSGVSNFAVAVEYTLVVALYILRVDREGVPQSYRV
jgi:Flp pilus assembly pilin Flp